MSQAHNEESFSRPRSPTGFDAEFGGLEARKRMERKIVRKLDIRNSFLVLLYLLNYIDRTNTSAARLRGFEQDLRLTDEQFDTVLSIFYVGYILMQVPSNMFLDYVGKPSIYLPVWMMVWGTISILMGIITNVTGAILTRFFLGLTETVFFPGALFMLSKWYKRDELGLRTAILLSGGIVSNGFGSLIASGILSGMEGKLGRAAWRWLFYIEGSLTISFALLGIFILPDFPANTRWLSPLERRLAVRRLQEDNNFQEEETENSGVQQLRALKDWKVWWLGVTLHLILVSTSFTTFFPTLSKTMGFNNTVTLLLCAPPWILCAICSFFVNRHSDATGERFCHIVIPLAIGILGYIIAMSTMNIVARYLSLFLMTNTFYTVGAFYAWVTSSIRHPSRRAVSLAFVNALCNSGNILGSYIWPIEWGPTYRNSFGTCLACSCVAIIMCLIFREHLRRENRRLEEEERRAGKDRKGFRYVL